VNPLPQSSSLQEVILNINRLLQQLEARITAIEARLTALEEG